MEESESLKDSNQPPHHYSQKIHMKWNSHFRMKEQEAVAGTKGIRTILLLEKNNFWGTFYTLFFRPEKNLTVCMCEVRVWV